MSGSWFLVQKRNSVLLIVMYGFKEINNNCSRIFPRTQGEKIHFLREELCYIAIFIKNIHCLQDR